MGEKSYFIVFEGIDGCGKTTQMLMAGKFLFELKRFDPILLTREPTIRNKGKKIWKLLRKDEDPKAGARKFLNLYFEDRKEHLRKDVLPVLKNGDSIVLCDRYKHATFAYQQGQGIPFREIGELHEGTLVPDLTLIFDVPANVAVGRMGTDAKRDKPHKFERLEFLKKVRQNYLALKRQLPNENIVVIDGDRPRDEVFRVVQKEIMKVIGEPEKPK